jgi:hypothetical protein
VAALRGAAGAYRRAARAAGSGNPDAYRAASAAIPLATARVNSALAGIQAAGYKPAVQGGADGGPRDDGDGESDGPGARSDVGDSRSDDPSDDQEEP